MMVSLLLIDSLLVRRAIIDSYFWFPAATVALDTDQIVVTEGNNTMNMTLDLNVVLTVVPPGGLERDVVVAISIYEITATGS